MGHEWQTSSSLPLIGRTQAPLDFFPTSGPLRLVDRYSLKYTEVLDLQQPNAFLLSLTNLIPTASSKDFVMFLAAAESRSREGKGGRRKGKRKEMKATESNGG